MKRGIIVFVVALMSITHVFAQDWQTDFTHAKELATKENKPIILVFQGSDWCAPCIRLNREIFESEVFKAYAKDNYVMLKADFPRKKENALSAEQAEANGKLAQTYNTRGIFPFVVVLDSTGKVLGEKGYKKTTPELYLKEINAFIE